MLAHKQVYCNSVRSNPITPDELDYALDKFLAIFQTLDMIFSLLQHMNPTEEEGSKIERSTNIFEKQWKELESTQTLKFHILVNHIIEQVYRFGGIADLLEVFVEKLHQIRNHLNHLTAHMSSQCYREQELVKIRRK